MSEVRFKDTINLIIELIKIDSFKLNGHLSIFLFLIFSFVS